MVKKKAPKTAIKPPLTLDEKKVDLMMFVEEMKKILGLSNWEIITEFDGTWTWNKTGYSTQAVVTLQSNYRRATIRLHEKLIPEFFDENRERLNRTILHELIHIQHAQFKQVHEDSIETLLTALRTSFKYRYDSVSEEITTNLTKLLNKDFAEESKMLVNLRTVMKTMEVKI